ncbi:Haloacid dehalogenase-like hydrolase [Moritella viscosa]|uniref:HAD family hydrolase n=1 Tax=Moritella viscosa TaxID=80854 RepID=UPI000916B061|nr:HAD-IA family hydrolase [Moritella viscosa]SGY94554.1 Haloacid dehalogenase-like hydrolase [Moritella viscosa]
MHPLSDYDIYIFDCDGVILDSNQLKIDAMRKTLIAIFNDEDQIDSCVEYFKCNFGKSRFHHVDIFLSKYINIDDTLKDRYKNDILKSYSGMCKKLYLEADLTPGFIDFIGSLNGYKFVASGSEQEELRYVFKQRGLDIYFNEIYGSPTPKSKLVSQILDEKKSNNVLFFGDALSDLSAALDNNIDFIAYLPFSNVEKKLIEMSLTNGFKGINHWSDIN